LQWDSSSAFKERCPFYFEDSGAEWRTETTVENWDYSRHTGGNSGTYPRYENTYTRTGSFTEVITINEDCDDVHSYSGSVSWTEINEQWNSDDSGSLDTTVGTQSSNGDGTCTETTTRTIQYYGPGRVPSGPPSVTPSSSTGSCGFSLGPGSAVITTTYSDEVTPASLRDEAVALLPPLDGDFSGDAPGSYYYEDGSRTDVQQSEYRFAFPVPHAFRRANYRVRWVERFIPEAGVALASVDVYSRGVYRPSVTIAPAGSGIDGHAIAVMAADGTIASIRVLNHGYYDAVPTVTIQAAVNGGTSSTGWTATLDGDGHITSITGGSAGDYRPTLTFAGGGLGATDAEATCDLDANGGIASVTLTDAGADYTDEPSIYIEAKIDPVPAAADLLIQLGTETVKCEVWSGTIPPGYDEEDDTTWPVLTVYPIDVPTTTGATLVANVRAVCDPSPCPP
jgi:hypothetical protein